MIDVFESGDDQDCNIVETHSYGMGSVMIWGRISNKGRTDFYVINGDTLTALLYRVELLDSIVKLLLGQSVTISF